MNKEFNDYIDRITQLKVKKRSRSFCEMCGDELFAKGNHKNTYQSYDYCDPCCEEGCEEEIRQAWEDEELIGRRIDGRIK